MKLFEALNNRAIGIDLGTANILVAIKGKGIVYREPSVVAINRINNELVAYGQEAKEMLGKTPENILALKPLKDGVIADFTATKLMLSNIVTKICKDYYIYRPKVVVGIPSGITEVEKRAVQEAILSCGASIVYLVDEQSSESAVWINVICAMSHYNQKFYVNGMDEKSLVERTLNNEVLYKDSSGNTINSFQPMRYFFGKSSNYLADSNLTVSKITNTKRIYYFIRNKYS